MELKGLSDAEVPRLLEKYGRNEIRDVGHVSPARILLRQVRKNFVIYLLIVAAILSFAVSELITGYTLIGIIVLVIGLGFFQEYHAETAINALRTMITPVSVVIRNGRQCEIHANELVPGDIVLLRTGERIPADCVVLEQTDLLVNESVLTGDPYEVPKKAHLAGKEQLPENELYMGSFVLNGRAVACVMHTGMTTKFGKIASLVSLEEKALPLQDKVNALARVLIVVAILSALFIGALFLIRADDMGRSTLVEMLVVMIALAVSTFPENLPVTLVTTLSSGTYRMARKNAIVNRMSVIETLGETTVICSDKTGTLTKGEMTAKKLFVDGRTYEVTGAGYSGEGSFMLDGVAQKLSTRTCESLLCKAAVLCNDATITRTGEDMIYQTIGAPTESALLIMASKAGIFKDDLKAIRKAEIPFSSARKLMSVLVQLGKDNYIFSKGAPEFLLKHCTHVQRKDGTFKLTDKERENYLAWSSAVNREAFRTIAIAYKPVSARTTGVEEKDLVLLGLVAMEDPPREEVRDALRQCVHAGISVKMITGDSKDTALSIARQIGLGTVCLVGDELDKLSDDELSVRINAISIFARVRPEHKLRIVNVLKSRGEVVTMTGDGTNDAPALKAAHIGVAMGKGGTDVARSIADLTLRDDNFSTIVAAIREGRTILNNMQKFISFLLSCKVAELMILVAGTAVGLPLPLLAIQILFMNMVTDDLPAITLGLNPSSDDVMERKPRKKATLVLPGHVPILILVGLIMGIGTLTVYSYALYVAHTSLVTARTVAMVTLIVSEIAAAFTFRSFRKGVLHRSLFVNRYLAWASVVSIGATLLVIYTPLNVFFGTTPLSWKWWALACAPAVVCAIVLDIVKAVNEKKNFLKEIT